MLQAIRDKAPGLVVIFIVGFICLTFALWGIQDYMDGTQTVIVAEVNGEDISLRTFQRKYQRIRQNEEARLGEAFNDDQWNKAALKQQVLDRMIEESLLAQLIDDIRVRISDRQLAQEIQNVPSFQQDGIFSQDFYRQRVRQLGFSEQGFEQQMRRDLSIQQLRSGAAGSSFVTQVEVQQMQQLLNQTRDFGYTVIAASDFSESISISDDDIQNRYEENKAAYVSEERFVLQYIQLAVIDLMDEVVVEELILQQYYQSNIANYEFKEERSANHILIQLDKDASADQLAAALKEAEELKTAAESGSDFETLAKENSDDIGSRAEGGETGFFGLGVMAPEFETATFALMPGEISTPVRTEFGIHLIKLNEIKAAGVKSFDEVRTEIDYQYRKAEAETMYSNQANQFTNLVYEHPDTLEVAAETLGLEIRGSESLTRSEISERFSPAVVEAILDTEVLVEGLNSPPVELSDARLLSVRVKEYIESQIKALDEVREEIRGVLNDERKRSAAKKLGETILTRVAAGEALDAIIDAEKLKWEEVEGARRDTTEASRAIVRAIFRADIGSEETPLVGVPIGTGDFAIFRVTRVQLPATETLDETQSKEIKTALEQTIAQHAWRDLIFSVRSDASVEIFPERI